MYFKRFKDEWWIEPSLRKKKVRLPRSVLDTDPLDIALSDTFYKESMIGAFGRSRQWERYNRLPYLDAGYVTPLYTLRAISLRYRLSVNSTKYFRKYILPEPFDVMRRRSVNAHHWSRFALTVLDVVLLDLESRGYTQFKKTYTEHIENYHNGVRFLESHYGNVLEDEMIHRRDKHGVQWIE